VALLPSPAGDRAVDALRGLLDDDDPEIRATAVRALGRSAAADATLAAPLTDDPIPGVRLAALGALSAAGPEALVAPALEALSDPDTSVRSAALRALSGVDLTAYASAVRALAELRAGLALGDHDLASSIPTDGDATTLLRDALRDRARRHALVSLSALSLVSDEGTSMRAAIENLDRSDPGLLATALEAMEAAAHAPLARRLVPLWETPASHPPAADGWLERALDDDDPVIRSCAELVRRRQERGDQMTGQTMSISPMERVLELRRIPLFAGLSPAELLRVAGIAEERSFANGEEIAQEGEIGEELYIILSGSVRVVRHEDGGAVDVARREAGDVVGEMSIISRAPRVASLIADGDVRTITIGRREFESMIAERPDIALAVMRALAARLGAATAEHAHRTG
jgi:hypothetical protein